MLQFARGCAQQQTVTMKEAWDYIAWGIDVVQQILETKSTARDKRHMSKQFFMALYSIVCSVQQRAPQGAEVLYDRYISMFKAYMKNEVAPAIVGKTADDQVRFHFFLGNTDLA